MSDGVARFSTVILPKDTARMLEHLVDATAEWAGLVTSGLADTEAERDAYRILCYARKWMAEHLESLHAEAGTSPRGDDQTFRFL